MCASALAWAAVLLGTWLSVAAWHRTFTRRVWKSGAGELLDERGPPAALVDLDWLGWVCGLPAIGGEGVHGLIRRNLAAIWPNLRAAGIRYAVLARAVQHAGQVDGLRGTLPDARITVVRLTASHATVAERLRARHTGAVLEEHLRETVEFERALDRAAVEDLRVSNEDRPIREVSLEILARIGWI